MKALIVEDNPVNYMVMRNQLAKLGVASQLCLHGGEAMAYCMNHGMPDLILLDGLMPQMDGISFLNWIRNYPGGEAPYILFCSSSLDKLDIARAMQLGADVHHPKPLAQADIMAAIAAATARMAPLEQAQHHR
jgi:two-component system, chemotaxis family, chemotaxis protein CheY